VDATAMNTKDAKILIVDDSSTQLILLKEILLSAGHTNIFETTDSRQVDYLHRTHQFDLILLDLNMPYLDGFQVIEQLKKIQPIEDGLSIIAVSGQTDEETQQRAHQLGAKDFIAKPFQIQKLLSQVHTQLENGKICL